MLSPNERFKIKFAGGKQQCSVVCLTAGKQSKLLNMLQEIQAAEAKNELATMGPLFLEALTMCVGDADKAQEMFDEVVDFEMIGEIIAATTAKQVVTEDDVKK